MNEHPTERLSAYLDGDLAAPDRVAVERHLAGCRECSAVLADLGRLARAARELEDREPATDLWPGIAGRLEGRAESRVIPIDAPEVQKTEMRRAFYAGGEAIMFRIMATLSAGKDEVTKADIQAMKDLNDEFREFAVAVLAGKA